MNSYQCLEVHICVKKNIHICVKKNKHFNDETRKLLLESSIKRQTFSIDLDDREHYLGILIKQKFNYLPPKKKNAILLVNRPILQKTVPIIITV